MRRPRALRALLAAAVAAATACLTATATGASAGSTLGAPTATTATVPPVKHVWVVELENKGYAETFAAAKPAAPYLARTLPAQGALLTQYYATGHVSLDNYVSEISGQGPNAVTQSDCQRYVDMRPGIVGLQGQAIGQGCVYPASVLTLPDQLAARHETWRGYMGDMGNDPAREEAACGRPLSGGAVADPSAPPGSPDDTQSATRTDSYAARHNPFVYFHSITDNAASCRSHVVPLTRLAGDLRTERTTPAFSWITPSLCDDGHDAPCADGRPGGLVSTDAFLRRYVPLIERSPAFHDGGLIVVTFDEAEVGSDASSCCGEEPGPNSPLPGATGFGGGLVGAVLVSPYIRPGTRSAVAYNHYSLLRSLEDLLGVRTGGSDSRGHLGYAGASGQRSFGRDVWTRWHG